MKRDWQKVRELMLAVEAGARVAPMELFTDDVEADAYMRLLHEAGFVERLIDARTHKREPGLMTDGLTFKGHDFLDVIRDDSVFSYLSDVIEASGPLPSAVVSELGLKFMKERLLHDGVRRVNLDRPL